MAKETEKPTRIAPAGAPGIARQFRDIGDDGSAARYITKGEEVRLNAKAIGAVWEHGKGDPTPRSSHYVPPPKVKKAEAPQAKAKRLGGRPPKHPDQPWLAEGVSRRTWERRQK